MLSEEQLQLRRTGVTGTDISAIMGENPWKRPLDVYLDKLGLSPETQQNEPMRWGTIMEPVILKEFQERHPDSTVTAHHDSKAFPIEGIQCIASPDAFVSHGNELEVVEIKTAGTSKGWDALPPVHYVMQVQWYLGCYGLERGHIAVLIGGNDYREYVIERDEKMIRAMQKAAAEFWSKHVEPKAPPLVDARFGDTVALFPAKEKEFDVTSDSMVLMYLEMIHETNEAIKKLQQENDKNKLAVVRMTDSAAKLVNAEGQTLASYVNVQRGPSINSKALKKKYPKAYKECLGSAPAPYSALRVYGDKVEALQ